MDTLNKTKGDNFQVLSQRQKIFGVADNTAFGYFEGGKESGERSEMLCVFYVGRRSLFDFYRIQFSVAVKQQVNFLPVGIAEEIQIGFLAGVIVRFQYFAHDKGFINAARHCAVCKRLRCQPAAEIANKARVRKIYFWRLDYAFIDVQGERLQKIDNVGRLQNREPALYRFAVAFNNSPVRLARAVINCVNARVSPTEPSCLTSRSI